MSKDRVISKHSSEWGEQGFSQWSRNTNYAEKQQTEVSRIGVRRIDSGDVKELQVSLAITQNFEKTSRTMHGYMKLTLEQADELVRMIQTVYEPPNLTLKGK